jgi:hypothetical protein
MKKKDFILYGKEKVLGKIRNVYVAAKAAKAAAKYVKYKGEFVKLRSFVKEREKKLYRKEEKGILYFFYGKGGGKFEDSVKFEKDVPVKLEQLKTIIDTFDNPENYDKYNNICNFIYTYTTPYGSYYIKPFIIIKEGHNIIFKFYFAYDKWLHPKNTKKLLWIEIPIHITQFFTERTHRITKVKSGSYIHITAEPDKLIAYNIYSITNLRHIYLVANSIADVIRMISNHGDDIFTNWVKHNVGDKEYKHVEFLTFYLLNSTNKWQQYTEKDATPLTQLTQPTPATPLTLNQDKNITERISYVLLGFIKARLHLIILDIFKYLNSDIDIKDDKPQKVGSFPDLQRIYFDSNIKYMRTQPRTQPQSQGRGQPQSQRRTPLTPLTQQPERGRGRGRG